MGTFVVLTGVLGWITSTPESLWIGLLVIRGLAGACNAPLHPGAAHVVHDVMPVYRRAGANGMVTAGALVGIACCYPGFGWLMDSLTWPWAFVVSGSMLIVFAALWGCSRRRHCRIRNRRLPQPRRRPSRTPRTQRARGRC